MNIPGVLRGVFPFKLLPFHPTAFDPPLISFWGTLQGRFLVLRLVGRLSFTWKKGRGWSAVPSPRRPRCSSLFDLSLPTCQRRSSSSRCRPDLHFVRRAALAALKRRVILLDFRVLVRILSFPSKSYRCTRQPWKRSVCTEIQVHVHCDLSKMHV